MAARSRFCARAGSTAAIASHRAGILWRAVFRGADATCLDHKEGRVLAEYQWWRKRRWETLAMTATGEPQAPGEGSHEEFITEHYWGYTARRSGCSEYRVEHPRWRLWQAETTKFEADVATLYGPQFVETLAAPAVSGFIAEGSPIQVHHKNRELK